MGLTRDELNAATFGSDTRNREAVLNQEMSIFEKDEQVRSRPFAGKIAPRRGAEISK